MFHVVGSGPAGVSCARALAETGAAVTILDSGLELERDRAERLADLAATPPSLWNNGRTDFLRAGLDASSAGIPLKLAYGSGYPYRSVPGSTPVNVDGADTSPSFCAGGLSTVWGGAILPY